MGNFADILTTKLASVNPSLNLHSIIHHRRFADLVSSIKTPTHPPYALMISRAIEELNEEGGSCEKAIMEFIIKEYENLPLAHEAILRHHLMKLCEKEELWLKDNDRYILQKNDAVEKCPTKRKKVRRNGKASRGDNKNGEEINGRGFGEGNRLREHEMEGIYENRAGEELFKGAEERSELGIDESAVSGAHMTKNMLGNGASDEALVQQFDKPEASQSLRNKEQQAKETEPVVDQKLVISEVVEEQLQLERVQTQHLQTEVTKEQLPLEVVQIQQQQTKEQIHLEENQHLQTKVIEEQLPSEVGQNQHPQTVEQNNLEENQHLQLEEQLPQLAEHQGTEKQCQLRDSKRTRDMEKNSEAEFPSVIHQHQNEPSLKRCRTQGSPAKPTSDVEEMLQGETKLSLPPQELENQTSRRLQWRILNPRESPASDSTTSTLTLSAVPGPRNEQQQKAVAQRILRSDRKELSVSNSASPTPTISCVPHKSKAQHKVLGKHQGRPPKLKPDTELKAKEQPSKERGRGRPRKPKPNADATNMVPTKAEVVTMASFSNSFLQKKLMAEKAKGQVGPRKPKPD